MREPDLRAFLKDRATVDTSARVSSSQLYSAALRWLAQHGRPTCSQKRFSLSVTRAGFSKIKSNGIYFAGLKLMTDNSPSVATSSETARVARRLLRQAMDEYYDDKNKRYVHPHTDASLAKEFNLSEAIVRRIREEDYGPILEPTEITEALAELERIKRSVASFEARLTALRNGRFQ